MKQRFLTLALTALLALLAGCRQTAPDNDALWRAAMAVAAHTRLKLKLVWNMEATKNTKVIFTNSEG